MKKTMTLGKKLSLNKQKLSQLNDKQLGHFLGGRMAAGTEYTAGAGSCSGVWTQCCSNGLTSCCA